MSLESLLKDSVSVYRKAPTKDTSGGQVANYTAVSGLTSLPASIQPLTGKAVRTHGQRQVFVTHMVYVDQDYGILRGDKLVNDATSESYVVHGIIDMGGQARAWRIECTLQTA